MARFIDDFDVVLLDMGNTFMFGCDRFFDPAQLFQTYADLGGASLDAATLATLIGDVLEVMYAESRDPAFYDSFRLVRAHLDEHVSTRDLPSAERDLIETVIARHECGQIPDQHATTVRALRNSHPVGLISNIWSPKGIFEAELERAGVLAAFELLVWSSDHGCIKPSPRLFQMALDHFGVAAARTVYVGDNPIADVGGATGVGMASVWVENEERPLRADGPQPTFIVRSLHALL